MTTHDLLRGVLDETGAPAPAIEAAVARLVAAYAEPHRHYHNLAHIAALLRLLKSDGQSLREPWQVQLAVLYHDAVYDPRASNNEACSAALASEQLEGLGVAAGVIGRVVFLIDMTRHGATHPEAGDTDLIRFLDFDLSVLGAAPAVYDAYANAIRREYAHVADADYRRGRSRILSMFLGQPAIFRSPDLRARWEESARGNLMMELARLDAGTPE